MRYSLIASLFIAGTSARDLRPRTNDPGPLAPNDPALNTPKFMRIPPDQALSLLSAKAVATPSAVRILPGVPLSVNAPSGTNVQDGPAETHVPNPQSASNPPTRVENGDATAAGSCTNPTTVYEYSSLTTQHKQQFSAAIKCLMGKPARSGLSGAKTRWDDFGAIHQRMNSIIHGVGQFLPWHRYFLWMWEQELRNTCGYAGPLAWWDETKNAGNFNGAAPFTSDSWSFGHMPDGNVVCIISGEFANTNLNIGPGGSNTVHCLSRGCNEGDSSKVTSSFVNTCNSYNDFNDMQSCSDYGPHGYGHDAIGGVMGDVQSSPGDPAFFLHHGFINRNWRIWQNADPSARVYQIGGDTTQNCGSNCQPTTLSYVLSSYNFFPNVTVDQVMDTEGGFLCYHYDY